MGRARHEAVEAAGMLRRGSPNSNCSYLWKIKPKRFCGYNSMKAIVCHPLPGTSRWNKIEHRLFAQISKNWQGRPPRSPEVIVSLIASTTIANLEIRCAIVPAAYEPGIKVKDEEMDSINIVREDPHGK